MGFSPARLLLPYGKVATVLRGPAKGMRFVARPGMGLSYAIGTQDAAPRFFARLVKEGDIVFDVGANQGQMTLILSRLAGDGHVISFEPSPTQRDFMLENLRLNSITNVSVVSSAASDSRGSATFLYAENHPTMGKLESARDYVVEGSMPQTVTTTTLDDSASESGIPAFVKLDVEGSGAAVLRGARNIIAQAKTAFYIELHGVEERSGVQRELLEKGYSAYTLDGQIIRDLNSGWNSRMLCKP